MTRDGVVGTAADGRMRSELGDWPRRPLFIKRDDGRLAPRYIEPAYPHTPAGGVTPNRLRRERQVAFALRNRTDLMIGSFYCGAAGMAGCAPADARSRVPLPRRPAKGSR